MNCFCGAEAVVVSGPTRLCHTHARALPPAELYRLERQKRAPAKAAKRERLRAAVAESERVEASTATWIGLRRTPRMRAVAVGRKLYG